MPDEDRDISWRVAPDMTGFGRDPGLVGRYEDLIGSGVYRSSTEHGSPR